MGKLAIVIPVLNEAQTLPDTLAAIQLAPEVEIIVVDGGSWDDTVAIAQHFGAIVITTQPSRAHQMNQGAAIATGETLLFLHGDTRLPPDFDHLIRQTLNQPGVVAGAFDLAIDAPGRGLRWVEWGVKWRSRVLQLPYGDQGIFLKPTTFHTVGGFPELPIMEDFQLVRRLQQIGRIAIAPATVLTSGRRWQKLGTWQTTLINQLVIFAFCLGISPARIATWYRNRLTKK